MNDHKMLHLPGIIKRLGSPPSHHTTFGPERLNRKIKLHCNSGRPSSIASELMNATYREFDVKIRSEQLGMDCTGDEQLHRGLVAPLRYMGKAARRGMLLLQGDNHDGAEGTNTGDKQTTGCSFYSLTNSSPALRFAFNLQSGCEGWEPNDPRSPVVRLSPVRRFYPPQPFVLSLRQYIGKVLVVPAEDVMIMAECYRGKLVMEEFNRYVMYLHVVVRDG